MKHKPHSSFCAAAAISAALALGSTSVLAQEAAPTITLPSPAAAAPPQAAPPSVPAPSIVLPEPAPAAPAAEAPANPAPRAERAAPRAARQAAAPAPAAAEPVSAVPVAPAEPVAAPDTPAPVPFDLGENDPQVAAAPAAEARQPDSVRSSVDVPDEIVIGSIVGVIGLGIAGFLALRRRRSDEVLLEDTYEPEPQFAAEAPAISIPAPLEVRPQPAPFAAGPVPTGEARQELIERMVAAEPDEENPFTSGTARRKRARIILQAREAEQGQQPAQPFDWRTYRSPERADPVPAPMVDA